MPCPNCGGTLIGDGVTMVWHCENVDLDPGCTPEPDANPVYCENAFSTVLRLYHSHFVKFRNKPTRLYIGAQAWDHLTAQVITKQFTDPGRVVHRSYMGMNVIETLDPNHIGVGE